MSRDRTENETGDGTKGGEDFAGRWSRLKRGAKAPPAEADHAPAAPRAPADPPVADERSDEEILRELDLPDPDTLKAGDDFKAFMTSAVPARIRNRALRRLWTSNPVLANLDRLVDYDHDYTDAAMVPALLKTGYKVGRGWMDDPAEAEAEQAAPAEETPAPTAEPEAEKMPATADAEARAPEVDQGDQGGDDQRDDQADDQADDRGGDEEVGDRHRHAGGAEPGCGRPPRMRFRFADE